MHLMTRSELSYKTEGELSALFGAVSRNLTARRCRCDKRRQALATLENIKREQALRLRC